MIEALRSISRGLTCLKLGHLGILFHIILYTMIHKATHTLQWLRYPSDVCAHTCTHMHTCMHTSTKQQLLHPFEIAPELRTKAVWLTNDRWTQNLQCKGSWNSKACAWDWAPQKYAMHMYKSQTRYLFLISLCLVGYQCAVHHSLTPAWSHNYCQWLWLMPIQVPLAGNEWESSDVTTYIAG